MTIENTSPNTEEFLNHSASPYLEQNQVGDPNRENPEILVTASTFKHDVNIYNIWFGGDEELPVTIQTL